MIIFIKKGSKNIKQHVKIQWDFTTIGNSFFAFRLAPLLHPPGHQFLDRIVIQGEGFRAFKDIPVCNAMF